MMDRKNRLTGILFLVSSVACLAAGAACAQPANNACAAALDVQAGTFTGTNSAATADCTGCGCSSSGARDVWYRYVAPADGTLQVDTCGTSMDTILTVHSGCPGNAANQLVCDDDGCGSAASALSLAVVSGRTYLIRVSGFGGATGSFTLHVSLGPPLPPPPPVNTGPDVTVGTVVDMRRWGAQTVEGVPVTAFSVGTDSCNRGTQPVSWIDIGPQETRHPVIAQNLYRLKTVGGATRFEQLGQSWLKHGFLSTNASACGTCQQPPLGGSQLGVNCSDTYDAGLNGAQELGPRSEVNPTTGVFPMPHGSGALGAAGQRIQVPTADLTNQPAGTRIFVDTHYVTQDDAQFVAAGATEAVNGLNNISYREVNATNLALTPSPAFVGGTVQQYPAIIAWRVADGGVTLMPVDVPEANPSVSFPGTTIRTRYWVGGRATDLGGGVWHYEYAVYNLNSDRAVGGIRIPVPNGATVTGIEFHAPRSHSGEPYSNAAWGNERGASTLRFRCESFSVNPGANAIRWGTLYNVRFDANVSPTRGQLELELFKPGEPGRLGVADMPVPTVAVCAADFNLDGDLNADDLGDYLTGYFSVPPEPRCDLNGGGVNADDLGEMITAYFGGC